MSEELSEQDKAEEKFVETKSKMQNAIAEFYEACQPVSVDNEGFAEDVNEAVAEATNGEVRFEPFI